jgi:large subunit ribosomal protein LP0
MSNEEVELSVAKRRKELYRGRLEAALEKYSNVLIIGVDHVGSSQLQQVRMALRGKGIVLMGKNTVIRRKLNDLVMAGKKHYASLIPFIRGNIGFVFTNDDMGEIADGVTSNKVPAAARTGVVANVDVYIPPGPTGLDPGQTPFFQALNIPTKIARGAIEIINRVHLIKEGDRVTSSAVALLGKLDIKPFFFGITICQCYSNGSCFPPSVLRLTDEFLLGHFFAAAGSVAAVSLELGIPTLASVRHSFINGFKMLLACSVETDYTFEEAKIFKEYLADPSKFAVAAAPAAGGAEEAKPAEESSSDDDDSASGSGLDLFG